MKDASVRIKLLLSVWLLIFAVLGTSTIVQVTTLRRDYLEAIEWRSEALAQSLIINITQAAQYILNVQELLETEALQCVKLYEASEAKASRILRLSMKRGKLPRITIIASCEHRLKALNSWSDFNDRKKPPFSMEIFIIPLFRFSSPQKTCFWEQLISDFRNRQLMKKSAISS